MESIVKRPKARLSFRIQPLLKERLKTEARRNNVSMNNYVEGMLAAMLYDTPNATTLAAMQETLSGRYAGEIDTQTRESFISSILGDEEED